MSNVKKFVVQCNFGGQIYPFSIYIGEPKDNVHPVYYQDNWLSKERGGNIPENVKESLDSLYKIAVENGLSFPDLCVYSLTVASKKKVKK